MIGNPSTIIEGLTRIQLGMLRVLCPDCDTFNGQVDVGIHPQLVDDDVVLLGVIYYPACGCLFVCRHLATRCGVLLENQERGLIAVENLFNLVRGDHDHVED